MYKGKERITSIDQSFICDHPLRQKVLPYRKIAKRGFQEHSSWIQKVKKHLRRLNPKFHSNKALPLETFPSSLFQCRQLACVNNSVFQYSV